MFVFLVFDFSLGTISGRDQGLLLALGSQITPGSLKRPYEDGTKDGNRVSQVQGQPPVLVF